jgi:hypothetical protein
MRQLFTVLLGSLAVMGFYLYESIIFGSALWYLWNVFELGTFTTLGVLSWYQAVAIIFITKILKFDSSKLGQQSNTPIILTKEMFKNATEENVENKN